MGLEEFQYKGGSLFPPLSVSTTDTMHIAKGKNKHRYWTTHGMLRPTIRLKSLRIMAN